MKKPIYQFLNDKNLNLKKYSNEDLYNAGIKGIIDNIDYYFDKEYTCESVLKQLFTIGIKDYIEKTGEN